MTRGMLKFCGTEYPATFTGPGIYEPAMWCLHYRLAGRMGATTPEPAEGAMHDRNVLIGMGATDIRVVEVKL